jgi:predicted DNA-binding transcriptional regulator YafY
MNDNDIKRISRLAAIATQLQTKSLLTATQLSKKFNVSIRTIYRDIKALEDAGIPVLTIEGKGYSLMEGYKIPPVMFTESEANALITAEQLLLSNADRSFTEELLAALNKIKAVLQFSTKEKVEFLANRIAVSPLLSRTQKSDLLTLIQHALIEFKVLHIHYHSLGKKEKTARLVEPFALYYCLEESWALIAYCRLRKEFRMFKLGNILKLELTELNFQPHKMTLQEYLREKEKKFTTPDTPLS